jgi:hypothetical protein
MNLVAEIISLPILTPKPILYPGGACAGIGFSGKNRQAGARRPERQKLRKERK